MDLVSSGLASGLVAVLETEAEGLAVELVEGLAAELAA